MGHPIWDFECLVGAGGQLNLEYGAALARAINDWQIEEWLEPEPRLRASIVVAYEDGELAAREIDRLGEHPGFVQVFWLHARVSPWDGASIGRYTRQRYVMTYQSAFTSVALGADRLPVPGGRPTTLRTMVACRKHFSHR